MMLPLYLATVLAISLLLAGYVLVLARLADRRWIGPLFAALTIGAMGVTLDGLGHARPYWSMVGLDGAELLGVGLDEDVAIYLTVRRKGDANRMLVQLPWDKDKAKEAYEALETSRASLGRPPTISSPQWLLGEVEFHEAPVEAPPPKE